LLTGLALGVGWTPCATPALGVTRLRVVRSALGRSGRAVQLTSGVLLVVQAVLVGTGLWERLAVQVMDLTARL
jgi:cytochrome c biogenesis protein CcdA